VTQTTQLPPREGQTFAGGSRIATYASFVKLPHTVFALPFALVGATLASYRHAVTFAMVGWIGLAFTAARFSAMGFNRIVDREFDARNPRTSGREIPRGALSVREAWIAVAVSSVLFVVAAGELNPLCLMLSPVALAWIFFYSFTKRFTSFAHIVLGLGLSIAPVGGYLAVAGAWSPRWWMLCALAIAVATWVGGFDILYALPDAEFDRANKLHSIPARLGVANAITVSRVLHTLTVVMLIVTGIGAGSMGIYFAGVGAAALVLAYEHSLVSASDLSRLGAAFFTLNGVMSIMFFLFVLAERLYAAVWFRTALLKGS
jgi:4-hydroxybenzoate polyprenyltransferase